MKCNLMAKIGEIAKKVLKVAEKHDCGESVLFGFGHGGIGNELCPLILDMLPWNNIELEPNMVKI